MEQSKHNVRRGTLFALIVLFSLLFALIVLVSLTAVSALEGDNGSSGMFFFSDAAGSVTGSSLSTGYISLFDYAGQTNSSSNSVGVLSGISTQQSASLSAVSCSALIYPNEKNLPSVAQVQVNYSIDSPAGFGGSTVDTYLELGSETYSATCSDDGGINTRNYTCTVPMDFYNEAGAYDAVVEFTLDSQIIESRASAVCTYGQLVATQRQTNSIAFASAGPGIVNSPGSNPLIIQNTGNVAVDLFLTAYNLKGIKTPSDTLLASAFKAGSTLGSSVQLDDGVQKDVAISITPGLSAIGNVHLWLSMPAAQIPQDYVTVTSWTVEATS